MRPMKQRPARKILSSAEVISKVQKILDLAESDPEKFRAECEKLAARAGMGVEKLYQMSQHPLAKRELQNLLLSQGTKLARRAFGL